MKLSRKLVTFGTALANKSLEVLVRFFLPYKYQFEEEMNEEVCAGTV